jgi:hypothetical protein
MVQKLPTNYNLSLPSANSAPAQVTEAGRLQGNAATLPPNYTI